MIHPLGSYCCILLWNSFWPPYISNRCQKLFPKIIQGAHKMYMYPSMPTSPQVSFCVCKL
uniref:Uncharacterized protein n=1 Tax=Triticum urartu TaxID=4572 RepID=A0A8R7UBT2_TRIUA